MVAAMQKPRIAVCGRAAGSTAFLCVAALIALAVGPDALGRQSATREGGPPRAGTPSFKVDPAWPLELPNNWILGAVTGVFVDARGHIWVTHLPETLTEEETSIVQNPPIATCC